MFIAHHHNIYILLIRWLVEQSIFSDLFCVIGFLVLIMQLSLNHNRMEEKFAKVGNPLLLDGDDTPQKQLGQNKERRHGTNLKIRKDKKRQCPLSSLKSVIIVFILMFLMFAVVILVDLKQISFFRTSQKINVDNKFVGQLLKTQQSAFNHRLKTKQEKIEYWSKLEDEKKGIQRWADYLRSRRIVVNNKNKSAKTDYIGIDERAEKIIKLLDQQQHNDISELKSLKFGQIPFCLLIQLHTMQSQQYRRNLVTSILSLNYTRFTSIFYGNQTPTFQTLAAISQELSFQYSIPEFYSLEVFHLNYYQYQSLIDSLCPRNSYVIFVEDPLKPHSLQKLNTLYQNNFFHMTYSSTKDYYQVHSFPKRVFDLIELNDFSGVNRGILERPNVQQFVCIAIMELCLKSSKKIEQKQIYNKQKLEKIKSKGTVIKKESKTMYPLQSYQPLFSLAQNKPINIEQIQGILEGKSQINVYEHEKMRKQMQKSLRLQSLQFLPLQLSANWDSQEYQMYNNLKEVSFCAVVIGGQGVPYQEDKDKLYTNFGSVFKQNYSNFRVLYFQANLDHITKQEINQLAKQNGFVENRFQIISKGKNAAQSFNLVRAAFQYCQSDQLLAIIDIDNVFMSKNYFRLMNLAHSYNPEAWMLYTNFKTDTHKLGYSYLLKNDHEYRGFKSRVKGLNYLPPLFVVEMNLFRSIPLSYHLNEQNQWISKCWLKALGHALVERSTTGHIEYIPKIEFSVPQAYIEIQNECLNLSIGKYIESMPLLKPLPQLNHKFDKIQSQIKKSIEIELSDRIQDI